MSRTIRIISPVSRRQGWSVDVLVSQRPGWAWVTVGYGPSAADALRDAIAHHDDDNNLRDLRAALADEEAK